MARCLRLLFSVTMVLFCLGGWIVSCAETQAIASPQSSFAAVARMGSPERKVDLAVLGYQHLSVGERLTGESNLSLDFLDANHVLFTFNPKKLFTRHAECPPTHADRLIHAAIVEIGSGKIVKEADWYLHDRNRYLWPLEPGRMLLRKLNSLYELDAGLQEKLILNSPGELLWVSVTPDGKQIIVESPDDAPDKSKKSSARSPVKIEFLDATSHVVKQVIHSQGGVNLEATSSGFASVTPSSSRKIWLIRFGPNDKDRMNIARVMSKRAPDVLYLSGNTMLIGRDTMTGADYSVSAFTVTGNRLWRQHWGSRRYAPAIVRSDDGSRFAVSSLKVVSSEAASSSSVTSTPKNTDKKYETIEARDGLEQDIQVFNTASGSTELAVSASPAFMNTQNFALSSNGLRLAVVRNTSIEFYDLPRMSEEDRAKYLAVKADVPGVYVSSPQETKADTKSEEEDQPGFRSVDEDTESAAAEAATKPALPENAEQPPATAAAQTGTQDAPVEQTLPANDQSAEPPSLTIKTSTQVVALDVVVTDVLGHPIQGVQQRDLVVTEDGKPQDVRYFNEATENPPPAQEVKTSPAPPVDLPPNIFTNSSQVPEISSVTVILYDLLNTSFGDQQRAKEELLKFLKNKPKDSQFALCILSNTLRMVQGFTPDETLLANSLNRQRGSLRYASIQNQQAGIEQTMADLQRMAAKAPTATAQQTALSGVTGLQLDEAVLQAQDIDLRINLTTDAFTHLARYLSGIPGRKSLIWLSGSFPLAIFPDMNIKSPYTQPQEYLNRMRQTVNMLAEAHVAVYPVDVKGLVSGVSLAGAMQGTGPGGARSFSNLGSLGFGGSAGGNLPGGGSQFQQETDEHGIMMQIASDTGGKAFFNSNNLENAMATATEQGSHYYALSYRPSNRNYDGKFRKIKVSFAPGTKKKYRLAYRSGYFAMDPDASGAPSKDAAAGWGLAAMQHGSPQSRQIVFVTRVVAIGKPRKVDGAAAGLQLPKNQKKKKGHAADASGPIEMQAYAIDYAVTPMHLRFDTTPDGIYHSVINFMVASFGQEGEPLTSIVSRAKNDLKPDTYKEMMTSGLRLHQEVDVPVKAGSLRMGVEDATSGHIGVLEIPLPVKAPPGVEHGWSRTMPEIEPD